MVHAPETINAIIDHWNDGFDAQTIANRLRLASRSAVLGIIHRVRLREPAQIIRQKFTAAQSARLGNRVAKRQRQPRGRIKDPGSERAKVPAFVRHAFPQPREDDVSRVSWDDLEPHHCRFIVGEHKGAVTSGAKMFCGKPKIPGTSWCEGHLARVVRSATIKTVRVESTKQLASSSAEFAPQHGD